MSYSSKQYLAYEELRMEPDSVIRTGNRRWHETSMAAKNRYFNQLTDKEREQLAMEYEDEQIKNQHRD